MTRRPLLWPLSARDKEIVMADEASDTAKVIALDKVAATRASERKWGKRVMDFGFCIVPSLLLRAQRRLGLSPTQLAILMHLADRWWDATQNPYPAKSTLADALNLQKRQVRRHIAELEKAGFIKREPRYKGRGNQTSNAYDLSGLVDKLRALEPDFRRAKQEAKQKLRDVTRPGLRPSRVSDKAG
jgi:DNA-binding MarR family transcriptional regulator